MTNTNKCYPTLHENSQYIEFKIGRFTARQKKNKQGLYLEKIYLYTNNGGAADYYDTTAFATFSSMWHLQQFIANTSEEINWNILTNVI